MGIKKLWKLLGIFMLLAAILTYASTQIANAALPIVETKPPYSASLRITEDIEGRIVFSEEYACYAPVAVKIDKVFVKAGQQLQSGKELLQLDVLSLQTTAESIKNEMAQNKINAKGGEGEALTLQKQITEMELELYRTNRELKKVLTEKKHDTDITLHKERAEETALQLEAAIAALDDYDSPSSVDNEERNLRRAVERIRLELKTPDLSEEKKQQLEEQLEGAELDLRAYQRIPSYNGSDDSVSQELNLELAVLQAEHRLILSTEGDEDEKNAAQLEYEAALLEYQQSQVQSEQQSMIDEKKLELSILDYQNQIDNLTKTAGTQSVSLRKNEELSHTLQKIENLIQENGMIRCEQNGELLSINAVEGERLPADSCLFRQCGTATAEIVWTMNEDRFAPDDPVVADLTVYELKSTGSGEEKHEAEKSVSLKITGKRYLAQEDAFEYTAAIPLGGSGQEEKESIDLAMSNQQAVKIALDKQLEEYETVVPVTAITFENEHKGSLFCMVEDPQGEFVSRKMDVDILAYDDKNAALKDSIHEEVIVYSDRPLKTEGAIRKYE